MKETQSTAALEAGFEHQGQRGTSVGSNGSASMTSKLALYDLLDGCSSRPLHCRCHELAPPLGALQHRVRSGNGAGGWHTRPSHLHKADVGARAAVAPFASYLETGMATLPPLLQTCVVCFQQSAEAGAGTCFPSLYRQSGIQDNIRRLSQLAEPHLRVVASQQVSSAIMTELIEGGFQRDNGRAASFNRLCKLLSRSRHNSMQLCLRQEPSQCIRLPALSAAMCNHSEGGAVQASEH
mmetsp:Transcript_26820/g.61844  ORF Transcript_26820/g.61844 Transcript_26820/m.61844 type:complete len:238 (+) Transcript_26820:1964-2677(+)